MTPSLSIILPYFNEQGWIGQTIDSLVAQSDRNFRLILVDNGSTDAGSREARQHAAPLDDAVEYLDCAAPGKIHALAMGLEHVRTPYVAICDADTCYPPDYVLRLLALFAAHPAASAIMAIDLQAPPDTEESKKRIVHVMRKSRRFAAKCHAGGYAQAFRADFLRQAGGFDAGLWSFVLEDHEIAHRVMRLGPACYHPSHVCFPSNRRASRRAVSWTAFERFVYRHTPPGRLDWFFYRFLGPRLAKRGGFGVALRDKPWTDPAP